MKQLAADGTTALHYAVYNDNVPLIERLIAKGADVKAANQFGSTPMIEAATFGNAAVIAKLLDAGADVESPGADGQTALMIVARSSNVAAAKVLLERGANANAAELWRQQTALMWAAAQAQPEMVKLLIEHGAQVDARSVENKWPRQVTGEPRRMYRPMGGLTPLLFAAREGCLECARALVEAGADINLTDPKNITPLFLAIDNFHFDLAKYLIEKGANVEQVGLVGPHAALLGRRLEHAAARRPRGPALDRRDHEPRDHPTAAREGREPERAAQARGRAVSAHRRRPRLRQHAHDRHDAAAARREDLRRAPR